MYLAQIAFYNELFGKARPHYPGLLVDWEVWGGQ